MASYSSILFRMINKALIRLPLCILLIQVASSSESSLPVTEKLITTYPKGLDCPSGSLPPGFPPPNGFQPSATYHAPPRSEEWLALSLSPSESLNPHLGISTIDRSAPKRFRFDLNVIPHVDDVPQDKFASLSAMGSVSNPRSHSLASNVEHEMPSQSDIVI